MDIDHYTDWEMDLEALREAKIPAPSFMVLSGRGIHFYWLLAHLTAQALPIWQRIQDALVDAMAHIAARTTEPRIAPGCCGWPVPSTARTARR